MKQSEHKCKACGVEYTITPPVHGNHRMTEHCLAPGCVTYEPKIWVDDPSKETAAIIYLG